MCGIIGYIGKRNPKDITDSSELIDYYVNKRMNEAVIEQKL